MNNTPTLLGTVKDVKGATIRVAMEESTVSGLVFIDGHGYRIGQIGSFVKIPLGYHELFGLVSQVGAGSVPENIAEKQPFGDRWMTVQLVGESVGGGEFRRGLSQHPTIEDKVHIVIEKDLERIYGNAGAVNFVQIGHLASAESIPALINIDQIVTRHSAVVGTTGSGKSTTVASLLASMTDTNRYPSARVVIIDVHGEYAAALKDRAAVFRVNPDPKRQEKHLCLPYWAMSFDEFLSLCLGDVDDKSIGALVERISDLKLASLAEHPKEGVDKDGFTVDSPVPFSIHEFWFNLYVELFSTHTVQGTGQSWDTIAYLLDEEGQPVDKGDAITARPPRFQPQRPGNIFLSQLGGNLNIRRHIEDLGTRLRDPRYGFLFRPGPWTSAPDGATVKDLDALIEEWLGNDSPITILDLSGTPPSIMIQVVGILVRIMYDALFWSRNLPEGGRHRPLLLVLEEAHAYLNAGNAGSATDAIRRVVREGRKYGIGAMVVSQRPSEIDPTILSQCGTIFALRLANAIDRGHIRSIVSDNLEGLLDMLPILRTGEAIIVGESVRLPVRTIIPPPAKNRMPDSSDPLVVPEKGMPGGWTATAHKEKYDAVIAAWRRQNVESPELRKDINMERIPVESSNVASIGYDSDTSTLEVEFQSGSVYQYFDVPEHVFDGFVQAPSKGQYLNHEIRDAYRYARM
jgi:uncharacterized protein